TDAPLGAIGKELGGRDHSTVVHALSAIEERLRRDAELRATVSLLEARLGGGSGWGGGWAVPGRAPRGARGVAAMPRAPRRGGPGHGGGAAGTEARLTGTATPLSASRSSAR